MSEQPSGGVFDRVPDLYDELRPDYPAALYDLVESVTGPVAGRRVLDLAAGPGLATRQLRDRGADVVAMDIGPGLIARLRRRSPDVSAVVARAESLPFAAGAFDLIACATAWHWVDAAAAVAEVRRVLRRDGQLALWWANNRHGDGIDWEDAQSDVYERWTVRRGSRPPGHEGVGPWQAAADLRDRGLDVILETSVEWQRTVDLETHLAVLRTHSDVLALGPEGDEFIDDIRRALRPWPRIVERLWGPLVVARMA